MWRPTNDDHSMCRQGRPRVRHLVYTVLLLWCRRHARAPPPTADLPVVYQLSTYRTATAENATNTNGAIFRGGDVPNGRSKLDGGSSTAHRNTDGQIRVQYRPPTDQSTNDFRNAGTTIRPDLPLLWASSRSQGCPIHGAPIATRQKRRKRMPFAGATDHALVPCTFSTVAPGRTACSPFSPCTCPHCKQCETGSAKRVVDLECE